MNGYEKIRMRQNPMLQSGVQVGGRPMPAWFSASLVNQSRTTMSTPPPLPAEPPPTTDESEYEEIDHLLQRHNGSRKSGRKRACSLCGNPNAVVSCEMCESQIFCGSCNDMYHRHPKRLHHVRKILDFVDNRPPLPPKTFVPQNAQAPSDAPIVSSLPPVPPPRRNKRFGGFALGGMRSATSSPTLVRKTFDPMGTLKRFVGGMGQRPLPPPPKQAPPLPPKSMDLGRPITPVMRGQMNPIDRRHSSPAPQMGMYPSDQRSRNIPLTVQDMQNVRHQSISVANLSIQRPPSRNNTFEGWEDEEDYFARQRAHSISTPHRYPSSSQDISHFATLQRPKRGPKPPERPPPPVPPRNFGSQSQLAFQSSQSAFNLHQMGMAPQFGMPPWNYPAPGYPFDFQQQGMMGYPGTMRRTPSNSSMGGGNQQQFFGWGPVGFGPPMTHQEMEMEILAARRESEQQWHNNQRAPSISQSQPVTPPGSFRRKTRPSLNPERPPKNESNINERFIQNQQMNQRSSTPSSFARVLPIFPQPTHSYESNHDPQPSSLEITENPEGPWTCEHCTFINPKSTKVCTICCKTPMDGYRSMTKKPNVHRKGSGSSGNDNNDTPVIQSKLSISRGEKQQATINLIESVERVRTPADKRLGTDMKASIELEDEDDDNEEELIRQAQHHQIKINTQRPRIVSAKSELKNSNEDVYGSVPVQALTISPKIEESRRRGIRSRFRADSSEKELEKKIRRPPKTVTTGVGSSPPKSAPDISERKSSLPKNNVEDTKFTELTEKPNAKPLHTDTVSKSSKGQSGNSSSSSSGKSQTIKKVSPIQLAKTQSPKQPHKISVSAGTQVDNGESGNESIRSAASNSNSSSSRSSDLMSSVASEIRSETSSKEQKRSKGTSPPPQSISTQTYDEIPASFHQQSMSKNSVTSLQSLQSEDLAPPKPIEMSEKALRYARKAQNHHQAKLKRSMSTHLTSASEPWADSIDSHGRPLYRSSSRHSLISDTRSLPLSGPPSRDTSPPRGGRFYEDFRQFPPPSWDRFPTPEDYFASLEDLVARRRRDSVRSQEFEHIRLLKDPEEYKYTPEDVQVALRMCGERNPIKWLQENWSSMVETVQTLATKYGREKGQDNNQIGTVSSTEAKDALRTHKGNVWAAVTECVEQRRKKFVELHSRGTFLREDILTALTANHGNLDAAYVELSKAQLKPFLMRIWGPPSGLDNDAVPPLPMSRGLDTESTGLSSEAKMRSGAPSTAKVDNKIGPEYAATTESPKSDSQTAAVIKEAPQAEAPKDIKLEELEPEPRLELLVSNAAKVSQEIEKAIQELKLTKGNFLDNKENPKPSSSGQPTPRQETQPQPISNLQAHNVKSDEDESFSDAISDSGVNPASPNEYFENAIVLEDGFDEDEDVLEIEIDDSEANISEFIQNYEVLPAKPLTPTNTGNDNSGNKEDSEKVDEINEKADVQPEVVVQEEVSEELSDITDPGTNKRLSSAEIEQLLNTLTTTFTEMGQFATEIKAKIASEIQQQLAAAVNVVQAHTDQSSESEEGVQLETGEALYEPVVLPESVSANVNKKMAKYKRLAAKKDPKSNRHKSPDARSLNKEQSVSPSPGRSVPLALPSEEDSPEVGNGFDQILNSQPTPFRNAEIEITGDPTSNIDNQNHPVGFLDYEEVQMPRDEGEYNSGSDLGSEESSAEEELESGEEVEEEESEELSSEEEAEVQEIFDNNRNEDYEEVEINHSSEFELYNNKDIDKVIVNSADIPKTHFVSSTVDVVLEEDTRQLKPRVEAQVGDPLNPKTETEVKVERLVAEGKVETAEKGELAIQLMDMNFCEEDSIHAANECSSLYGALSFLQQECDLCAGKFSARQMVSMLRCTHICCQNCAKEYFTVQVRDKSIVDATCPFCSEPTHLTDDTEGATDYFNHLDILLKSILDSRHHEMFQRKLRDWALAQTPNFKWCSKCSSGFITEPLQTRLICPDCNAVTCAICLEQWDKFNHDHRESKVKVCDSASKSIVDYLNENCIECPRCHFRFALARGGCMHLTCTQCRHEFCSGCSASFRMGDKCEAKLPICDRLGLHAHHPRNCLFYLRDKEPDILCKLLEESAIPYLKENSGSTLNESEAALASSSERFCQVPIQKETTTGLRDDICGKDAPAGYANVCQPHYVEYLGLLIWQNQLDPISILSSDDLEVIIRRANKKHPGRPYPTSDEEFRNRLLKVIQEEIPL